MSPVQMMVDRMGGPRRATIAVVGAAFAVLILVVSRAMTAPTMVPVVSGAPLEQSSVLTDKLGEAGIAFKLDRGGSDILVSQEDLARARVTLAKGGLASGARPGLELFDRQTWGWNDFTQRVNYRRALEGELERTISHMRGIERAAVHIALTEQSAFRRGTERPSTASVLVALGAGQSPTPESVRGIAQLVSSSVDGLLIENVSIHDETGRIWSESNDSSLASLTSRQLRVQQEMEKYLEHKGSALLEELVGAGNARVRVTATVNFDRIERTTQSVDPAKQALVNEQKSEIVPGAQGGAGSTTIANSYDNSKSTETFSSGGGNLRRMTVAVLINDRRLAPSGPADTIPRFEPRTAPELAGIEALVRSALGADSTRGDVVTVISQSFARPLPIVGSREAEPTSVADQITRWQRPALSLLGIVALLIVGAMTVRALRVPPASMTTQSPAMISAAPAAAPAMAAPMPAAPRIEFAPADTQVRDKVVATVQENPDTALRLVKAWIKEG
jgi:flagellar M-ring protein FliF